VYGRARKWRAIRAIPSEPALNAKRTEQFFKPCGRKIYFRKQQTCEFPDRRAQTNNTISYASRVTKPAFSAYASNPSHVATSYAVPNPELFLLFVTNQSP
jgi:hypothetical protein